MTIGYFSIQGFIGVPWYRSVFKTISQLTHGTIHSLGLCLNMQGFTEFIRVCSTSLLINIMQMLGEHEFVRLTPVVWVPDCINIQGTITQESILQVHDPILNRTTFSCQEKGLLKIKNYLKSMNY